MLAIGLFLIPSGLITAELGTTYPDQGGIYSWVKRAYGERIVYPASRSGNSGHYYIDRNGLLEEWVPPERIAHHVRGFNERSLGIELVNRGRFPDWYHSACQQMTEPYPGVQIEALIALLRALSPAEELSVEAEMQQHFPFARLGDDNSPHARLRLPTTAHGSL